MLGKIKKIKVRWFVIVLLIIAGLILGVVIHNRNKQKESAHAEEKKQSSITLKKMDLTKSISATGTIGSRNSKIISAAVNDVVIEKVNVAVGDEVKKGDVLVAFDVSDLQDSLSDAQESLSDAREESSDSVSSAQEKLNDAKKNYQEEKAAQTEKVSTARKALKTAKKKVDSLKKKVSAEKNMERKTALQEQLTKAQEEKKNAQTEYDAALNNRESTNKQNKSNIENAEDSLRTAQSNGNKSIKEAQKQVDEAEKNLEKCSVTASISGTITAVNVESGDTYSGGEMFQIDDTSSYTVSTTVDEYDISDVSVGQKVVILTEATDEDELEGEISFVAPSTNSTSSTQSSEGNGMNSSSSDGYEVKISVKTKDKRLKMGLTAKCSIILEEAEDVYAVPYDAIQEKKDGSSVIYIKESGESSENENQTELSVTKGMESDYYVEISGEGLSEGLQVVIPTDMTTSGSSEKDDSGQDSFGLFGGAPGDGGQGEKGSMGGNGGPRGNGTGSAPGGAPGGRGN